VFQLDELYTEFYTVSFGHIFCYEFDYPVSFNRVNIHLKWIAKDAGIIIARFI